VLGTTWAISWRSMNLAKADLSAADAEGDVERLRAENARLIAVLETHGID